MPTRSAVVSALALAASLVVATVPALAADDPLGTIVIAPGAPVSIGGWGALSGEEAGSTEEWMNAVDLAIERQGGMLHGHELRLLRVDAACSEEGGASAAAELVADPSVVALLGGHCSGETTGGIATVDAAGLTTISPSNTRASFTATDREPELAAYLRTIPSDATLAAVAASYAHDVLGRTSVVTIDDGSLYATDLAALFGTAFTDLGGSVAGSLTMGKASSAAQVALDAAAALAPDLLFLALLPGDGADLVDGIADVPALAGASVVGGDGLFSQEFVATAGPAADGVYVTGPAFAMYAPSYATLVADYTAAYGVAPTGAYHATAYDAAGILVAALDAVAVEGSDGSLTIGKGALRDAIYATAGFPGVTGQLSCTATGDCGAPDIAVYAIDQQVVDGAWPPPVAGSAG
jgi:branched-chain amino acid transport system substrate-binding protein